MFTHCEVKSTRTITRTLEGIGIEKGSEELGSQEEKIKVLNLMSSHTKDE